MATYSVRKIGGEEVARFSYLSGAKESCDTEAAKTGEIHYIVKEELVWTSQTLDQILSEDNDDMYSPIQV